MTDDTARTEPAVEAAEQHRGGATHIRTCQRCGSHFAQDYEELHCWNCIAWAELHGQVMDYARAVAGPKGGRAR